MLQQCLCSKFLFGAVYKDTSKRLGLHGVYLELQKGHVSNLVLEAQQSTDRTYRRQGNTS